MARVNSPGYGAKMAELYEQSVDHLLEDLKRPRRGSSEVGLKSMLVRGLATSDGGWV